METTLPPTDYPTRGRVAAGLVAGLLFLLPVARYDGFLYPHFSLLVLFHLAVLALLLIWAFPVRAAAPRSSGSYSAQILLGAYALVSVASCFWAPDRRLSAIGSIPIVFGVIWALLLGQLLRDPRDVRLILRGAFLAGTLAALSASYYVLREGQISFVEKVLGHRNFLAIFLLPPILFGLADLFSPILVPGARRDSVLGLPDVVVSVCVALMILALLMCKSWGALLGLAAGAICLLACRLSWQKRAYILFGAIGLVVVGLAVLSLPSISARLIKHAQATRWFMWQGALRMIADRPLLGWGSGMFMPYFADYKPTAPMEYGWLTVITIYPHNELLLVVAEGGMLALALYVGAWRRHAQPPVRHGIGGGAKPASCGMGRVRKFRCDDSPRACLRGAQVLGAVRPVLDAAWPDACLAATRSTAESSKTFRQHRPSDGILCCRGHRNTAAVGRGVV